MDEKFSEIMIVVSSSHKAIEHEEEWEEKDGELAVVMNPVCIPGLARATVSN